MGEDFDYKYDWTNEECNIAENYYKRKASLTDNFGSNDLK
jgi:hypothetical protein